MSVYRERIPTNHPALKRNIHHDSRSWDYRYDTSGLTIRTVEHTRHIPILDQANVGACTGNAGVGSMGTDPLYGPYIGQILTVNEENLQRTGTGLTVASAPPPMPPFTLDEPGALALYSAAEDLDGDGPYPPNDNGSSGLSIAKVLLKTGAISGYQHTFTLDDCLKALSQTPVMLGVSWMQDMFNPDPDGRLHITGEIAGGHEIECAEVDADKEIVWITNSWGSSWGVAGRAYLTFDDLGTLLADNGDVTILLPLAVTPAPDPEPPAPSPAPPVDPLIVMTTVLDPWSKARHTGANARAAAAYRTWRETTAA